MKHQFPLPLKIDCSGLSQKRTCELADKLAEHFDTVEHWGDGEISAHKPKGMYHYGLAWNLIDRYGVKAI